MMASDRYHLQRYEQERVIEIDTRQVNITEFNLTNEAKDYLYKNGYQATKNFLLNRWSWERHLRTRGYDITKTPTVASVDP